MIARVLEKEGATGCRAERSRVECRYSGRYVAGMVADGEYGMSIAAVRGSWESGMGQSVLGDQGAFAVLSGPNWLVTGPVPMVEGVRGALAGRLVRCDRPYGSCG